MLPVATTIHFAKSLPRVQAAQQSATVLDAVQMLEQPVFHELTAQAKPF
jgi:hypothetical protein